MKRLTAILCLLCLLVSLMLPAQAEDEQQIETCTETQGCVLSAGHDGDCFVPCTKTEGCTLTADHEGNCVLPEQPKARNSGPAFYLWFMDGDNEIRLTEVSGQINAQIRFNGQPLTVEQISYNGVSIDAISGEGGYYHISPNPGGKISYTDDGTTYEIVVNAANQNGPTLRFVTDGMQGDYLKLNVGESFECQIYYLDTQLTELSDLSCDNTGLEITVDNGIFTIKSLKPGNHVISHENGRIQVDSVDENGFNLLIPDGNGEVLTNTVTGSVVAQMRFGNQVLKAEDVLLEGVSLEIADDVHFFYRIIPNPSGKITYTVDSTTYEIIVNAGSGSSGPMLNFQYPEGQKQNYLNLVTGESITGQIYYGDELVTSVEQLTFDGTKLKITLVNNAFTIEALAPGECEIAHEGAVIRVFSVAQTIPDAGVSDGLYFYFGRDESEKTVFFGEVNFTNSFSSPLYVVIDGTASLISSGDNVTVYPATGLNYGFRNGKLFLEKQKAGHYTISCTVDGTTYSAVANVTEERDMYARINGEGDLLRTLTVTEGEPVVLKFYYISQSGAEIPVRGQVKGNDDCVQIVYNPETQLYTLTASGTGEIKYAVYESDDVTTYFLSIIRQKASYLAVDAGNGLQYDLMLDAGQEVPVRFFFGKESTGMRPYGGEITCTEGLTRTEKDGKIFLSAAVAGEYTISTTVEGKTYSVPVKVVPALSGGSLFALMKGSGSPQFSTAILCGEERSLRLCYGSYGQYETLGTGQLTVSGNSVTVQDNGAGGLVLKGIQVGQTLLQYTDGDQITHNYVIKCYASSDEALFARYSPFATDATVILPYGGRDLSVGFAYHTEDTMYLWPGSSVYMNGNEDTGLDDALCLGAMQVQGDYTVGELADPGFYSSVSNVNISIFSGTNAQNLQLGQRESLSWQGVQLYQFSTHAQPGANFSLQLLLTFDVQLDGKTCRFYRIAPFSYKTEPYDDVTVNITDADVLNTLLSNRDVLINYLEANVNGYHYSGGSVTLNLPAASYDKIIVSQIKLTGSNDYMATLTLKGTPGTTMPGLFSKGFLTYVEGITFVSSGQTMPDGKNCGIMVDNSPTTYQPEFDLDTLKAYHPDFQGLSNEQAAQKLQSYSPSVPTSGNAYNIGEVNNCTFSGFDYAMYSTESGIITSGHGNTITDCGYGYYLDCTGKESFARELNFWENTFRSISNAAVYIGKLPCDLDPYYIRFQDNKFYGTTKDFHVTSGGKYYFQRNYYDDAGSHRGARLTEENSAQVYTCPCRSLADSTDKLWIYADQRTAIFQSQASEMTVDPACIPLLNSDVTVPVLDEKQNVVAEWMITKKGGSAQ